jgi:hypothetical protein
MTDDLQLLRRVRPQVGPPSAEVKAAARRSLDQAMTAPRGRRGPRVPWGSGVGLLVPALSALVVVAVVALFLGLHTQKSTGGGGQSGLRLVFRPLHNPPSHPVSPAMMERTLLLVRHRLDASWPGARAVSHGDRLVVTTGAATQASTAEVAATVAGGSRLYFYDWEADALTPSGLPAARLLQRRNPSAIEISQGSSSSQPGAPGAGSLPLYGAVRLAARQPRWASPTNSRPGPEYFLFGGTGSAACRAAARYYHTGPQGQPCYLSGPQPGRRSLDDALPSGVSPSEPGIHLLTVRQGWVVLQAVPQSFGQRRPWSDPAAQYYVLRDNVSLSSQSLINAHQSTDQTGAPDVTFGFTPRGGAEFQTLTARIARRGQLVAGLGQKLYQHFAVALDTQLITVPYIDYTADPDGIPGNNGADIQGGFTRHTARALAAQITPLPVTLELVSASGRH